MSDHDMNPGWMTEAELSAHRELLARIEADKELCRRLWPDHDDKGQRFDVV